MLRSVFELVVGRTSLSHHPGSGQGVATEGQPELHRSRAVACSCRKVDSRVSQLEAGR